MAERDGGSTLVYPQTELYRPFRVSYLYIYNNTFIHYI